MVSSVAIVGAGPSGLVALDALVRENNFDVIKVFERRPEAGGCWVYFDAKPDPLGDVTLLAARKLETEPIPESLPTHTAKSLARRFMDTATYSYLETNVEAEAMEFSEERFPLGGSQASVDKYGESTPFRHHLVIKNWIQDLYKKKGYHDKIHFNTSVEMCTLVDGKRSLVLRKFGDDQDYVWEERFDAVVVACGHYDVPYVPDFPGLQQFVDHSSRTVIHSKAFRGPQEFANKKVVVVGASVSAMDAVRDLLHHCEVISSRKSSSGPHIHFGSIAFEHPLVESRGQITSCDAETGTLHFEDGTSTSGVDAIIFGTGFSFSFPFLPELDLSHNRVHNLYQHIFKIGDPTLVFVGAITPGLTFKAYEWQAVAAAKVLAGRSTLPSIAAQKKWEQDRIACKGDGPGFCLIYPRFEEYFEALRAIAGEEGPGRKLPKFDQKWFESFERGHQMRQDHWRTVNANYKPEKS